MKRFAVALAALLAVASAGPSGDTVTIDIKEWPVPYEKTRPRDPYVDQQNRVWFVGQAGDYIAYLTPDSGEFKKYDLHEGAAPHNLVVDRQGTVWYAGNRHAYIGKLDPATGNVERIPMPDPAARDPHTLTFDRNGDIFFTAQGGNFVGKLETRTGKVHLIRVPTERARPYGIVVNSKNEPWVVLFNTNKLAKIDTQTMTLKEIELPRPETRPRRLAMDSQDRIWYVDYANGMIGVYDPASGKVDEWASPGGEGSRPYGVAMDADDRFWYVETGPDPNKFIGFDTKSKQFFSSTDIPSGGGTVRHMYFHRPGNEIWFGTDTNYIGRAKVH